MKKRILSLALLCFLLGACSSAGYRTDVSCATVAEHICRRLPLTNGYAAFGDEKIEVTFPDAELLKEYAWLYSVDSADINEIGVFKAATQEAAKAAEVKLSDYLAEIQEHDRAFIASYAPTELTKLDSAEIRRFGCYVILCICQPEELAECMEAASDLLSST